MNKTFVAVLFEKHYINDRICSFVPYDVMEGQIDENNIFKDSTGYEHPSIKTNKRGLSEAYYAFPMPLEELQKRYQGRSDSKELYLRKYKGNIYFGLNIGNIELEIVSFSLEPLNQMLEEGPKNESGKQFVITPIKNIEENKGGNL